MFQSMHWAFQPPAPIPLNACASAARHVQLGWMLGDDSSPPIPMDLVMGWELEIIGSHGMQAHRYGEMLAMIANGQLAPDKLVHEEISLHQSIDALANFEKHLRAGMTIITDFS